MFWLPRGFLQDSGAGFDPVLGGIAFPQTHVGGMTAQAYLEGVLGKGRGRRPQSAGGPGPWARLSGPVLRSRLPLSRQPHCGLVVLASRFPPDLVLCARQAACEWAPRYLDAERGPVPPWVDGDFSSRWRGHPFPPFWSLSSPCDVCLIP